MDLLNCELHSGEMKSGKGRVIGIQCKTKKNPKRMFAGFLNSQYI